MTAVPPPPHRPADAHKGTFGTVIVVGGSPTMIGAPALAAAAALRSGAGLVKIATAPDVLPHCIGIEPGATGLVLPRGGDAPACDRFVEALGDQVVLAVGPGFGVGPDQQAWVQRFLAQPRPVVLDADGLNNLAALSPSVANGSRGPLVLTPHPGEYRRLARSAGIEADPLHVDHRPRAAAALAEAYGAVVVLKGEHTVVSDGTFEFINHSGNPALATAGSGDVLTGALSAFIAQGLSASEAAVLAVHVHGLAADIWAEGNGPVGLKAMDLADLVPAALRRHGEAS